MYLNSIFTDPEKAERWLEIAVSSLQPMLEGALLYTIPLTILSFIIGLILAILTALARISHVKILQGIARVYVSIIRGTPLLV
jgi:L-cystine transport system permease protein